MIPKTRSLSRFAATTWAGVFVLPLAAGLVVSACEPSLEDEGEGEGEAEAEAEAEAGSGGDDFGDLEFDRKLLDPKNCEECHPTHYRQWLGSMHAYASEDPVFRAMNARGQRETDGELGDFCIRCHAPMAVELGFTNDGLNLDDVPKELHGVTCYFCHNAVDVNGTHNNPIELARDNEMRGSFSNPVENDFHDAGYGSYVDARTLKSGDMCGSCHDIQNGHGVALERTFQEWKDSFFSTPSATNPELTSSGIGQSCADCHMSRVEDVPVADYPGVQSRVQRDHSMVGVDIALTDFPDAELGPELRAEQQAKIDLVRAGVLCAAVCVHESEAGNATMDLWLHNESAGHKWPSGATQDRRAWLEVQAWSADDLVYSSGVVAPGQSIDDLEDPNLILFRDYMYDDDGNEVHMFWEAKSNDGRQLDIAEELSGRADVSTWMCESRQLDVPTVDRVSTQMWFEPMSLSVLDDLVDSGDLDPNIRDKMPRSVVPSASIEWSRDAEDLYQDEFRGMCVFSTWGCFRPLVDEMATCSGADR